MNTIALFVIYAAVAVAISTRVFYIGVLRTPRISVFALSDYGILAIASVAVGALWLLFLPSMITVGIVGIVRALRARRAGWGLTRPHTVNAGS